MFAMAQAPQKKIKCTVLKASHNVHAAFMAGPMQQAKGGDPPPDELVLLDSEKSGFTIFGRNAGGARVDISGVASLTPPPVANDPNILTVGAVNGMHCDVAGVTAGPVVVTVTATWKDGSVGPFVIDIAGTVGQDQKVTGLVFTIDSATPK
jgi:hypothetical protein